ncbi:MAG: DUF4270 family protein [Cyclobacteriaceae bacterium]
MSLWGRIAGSAFLAFIFIISCREDDVSTLGFKGGANKFKASYIEIPLPSSVMTYDSVRTFTDPNQMLDHRLLVGRYVDNAFGEVSAEAFTQFGPLEPTVTIPETAEVSAAYLILSFDFYHYGGNEIGNNTFTVHELLDSIPPTDPNELPASVQRVANYQPYYFNSTVPFDPTPIGSASFQVDPEVFDQTLDDMRNNPSELDHKTIDTLAIQLNDDFATRLFDFARGQSEDYKNQRRFRRIFKGLAIRPSGTDSKIVGFNQDIDSTQFTKSRIIINYDEIDPNNGEKTRKVLEYSIYEISNSSVVFNFSRITAQRSGTALASLTSPRVESELDGNRYCQSGNPVATKVYFDKFLEFADTIPNVIFNSVEFSIDVDDAETFPPPSTLRLRYVDENNHFINFYSNRESDIAFPVYPASMTYDEEGWYIMGQRLNSATVGTLFDINYDPENRQYRGDLTDYFQTLRDLEDDELRYTDYILYAKTPHSGISVNRTIFKPENAKLKVFYTVPVVNDNKE